MKYSSFFFFTLSQNTPPPKPPSTFPPPPPTHTSTSTTRMHSSRMRTAHSSSRPRGVSTRHPPGTRPPWEQTPPWSTPPLGPDASPPWTEFLTHAYENITLPQTSFVGGNKAFQSNASQLLVNRWATWWTSLNMSGAWVLHREGAGLGSCTGNPH